VPIKDALRNRENAHAVFRHVFRGLHDATAVGFDALDQSGETRRDETKYHFAGWSITPVAS